MAATQIPLKNIQVPYYVTGLDNALPFVTAKSAETTNYATDAILAANQYITDWINYLKTIQALDTTIIVSPINTTVVVDDIDTTITPTDINMDIGIDPLELLTNIPVSPIKDSDYNITIPDELAWMFENDKFNSTLLEQIKISLNYIILNGISILPELETAMYDRETERNVLANNDAKEAIANEWSKRGFSLPGVGLFNTMSQVDTEYQNKMIDKARAIVEEMRKMELQMEQFALESGQKAVAVDFQSHDAYYNRSLEAAKAMVLYGLQIAETEVKVLVAKIQAWSEDIKAYATQAEIYKIAADIATSEIDAEVKVYNADMQGQVAEVNGNVEEGKLKVMGRTAELDAKIKEQAEKVTAQIAELDAMTKWLTMKYGYDTEAFKTMAGIEAQIGASALSAFHASAALSTSTNFGASTSITVGESYQHQQQT